MAGALFSFTSVSLVLLGSTVWRVRGTPIGGVMSSAAVAVALGAAKLVWLDQQQKQSVLVSISGDGLCGRDMRTMWWLAASCFVVAAFLFLYVLVTRYHSRWCRGQARLSTRGWTWSCALLPNMLRSMSRIRIGHGCTAGIDFPSLAGVLKGGLGCSRSVVLGHLARTKMLGLQEQFGVARLLEDIVELVYMGYPLSVIRGLVHSLPCSRVAQICRQTVRTWISLRKNRMVDDKRDQRQKPRNERRRCSSEAVSWPQRFWVAESWSRLR